MAKRTIAEVDASIERLKLALHVCWDEKKRLRQLEAERGERKSRAAQRRRIAAQQRVILSLDRVHESIDVLGLPARARNACANLGIQKVGQLLTYERWEFRRLQNFGEKSWLALGQRLADLKIIGRAGWKKRRPGLELPAEFLAEKAERERLREEVRERRRQEWERERPERDKEEAERNAWLAAYKTKRQAAIRRWENSFGPPVPRPQPAEVVREGGNIYISIYVSGEGKYHLEPEIAGYGGSLSEDDAAYYFSLAEQELKFESLDEAKAEAVRLLTKPH